MSTSDNGGAPSRACAASLTRAWLLGRLAAHLEPLRGRLEPALALDNEELIEGVAGKQGETVREQLRTLDVDALIRRCRTIGCEPICRCDPAFPPPLAEPPDGPDALFVAGDLERFLSAARRDAVAIVGARRASEYGLEVARSLGRDLGRAGITVVSGMAFGTDSAAHAGALDAGAVTVAVLPGSVERPYPPSKRGLYRRIRESGAVVSELPPGAAIWRWMFRARNRIIASLSAMTVVVEATERSGALLTAGFARERGRALGAVPGRVTSPLAAGPNELLARGATVVRGPHDVLDRLFGEGARPLQAPPRPALEPDLARLLDAIGAGIDTPGALAGAGFPAERALAGLATLELTGYVRRRSAAKFVIIP